MKKLFIILLALTLIFSLTACQTETEAPTEPAVTLPSETDPLPEQTAQETQSTQSYEIPLTAVALSQISESFTEENTELFTYTYQNLELTLKDPQVTNDIIIDYLNRVDHSNSSASKVLAEAKRDYDGSLDWSPYSLSLVFAPMRLDQSILSLYGSQIVTNGSPRPTASHISLNYDLVSGRYLSLRDILTPDYSADTLAGCITDALHELSESGVLYSDYAYVISEMFATNTPVETWYFSREGLCFYFAPYEIAPYNAGTVVATVPYSALTGTLKDAYFPSEEITLTGHMVMTGFQETDYSRFTTFAELILDSKGAEYLLHTEGTVQNVRLEQGIWQNDGTFTPISTVFAAATFCGKDALMLQAEDHNLENLCLTYESDGTTVTVSLSSLLK